MKRASSEHLYSVELLKGSITLISFSPNLPPSRTTRSGISLWVKRLCVSKAHGSEAKSLIVHKGARQKTSLVLCPAQIRPVEKSMEQDLEANPDSNPSSWMLKNYNLSLDVNEVFLHPDSVPFHALFFFSNNFESSIIF